MFDSSKSSRAAKFEAAVAHSQELRDALEAANACGFDPEKVPFLMKPKELAAKAKRDRSQVDMSIYEGGSAYDADERRVVRVGEFEHGLVEAGAVVVAQVDDRELDCLVASRDQRHVARVNLEAQVPKELDEGVSSLHAFLGERDEMSENVERCSSK